MVTGQRPPNGQEDQELRKEFWVDAFVEAMFAERSAAPNTCDAYARDLASFCRFLARSGTDLETAGEDEIVEYLHHLTAAGMARSTRSRHLSTLRQFYRFANAEGWLTGDPVRTIHNPKQQRTLPLVLTVAEIENMLETARKFGRTGRSHARNTCLLELMYATGARVSEVASLPVAVVRGNPELLLLLGKGSKERLVPIAESARVAIQRWLPRRDRADDLHRQAGNPPSPYLFPSRGRTGHLTRHRIYSLLKEIAAAAGVTPARVTPHAFRHAVATHLLENGADLRAIQSILGHADIATTEIYTHVAGRQMQELVLAMHPLARNQG